MFKSPGELVAGDVVRWSGRVLSILWVQLADVHVGDVRDGLPTEQRVVAGVGSADLDAPCEVWFRSGDRVMVL